MSLLTDAREQQLLLLEEARRMVAVPKQTMMLPTIAHLRTAVEALDSVCADYDARDALLDSKDAQINQLHDEVAAAQEAAGTAMMERDRLQADLRAVRDENLVTERTLTEAKNQLAEFQARLEQLAQTIDEHFGKSALLSVEAHQILREARATMPARPYGVELVEARG
jgi:uncharacterized protein (DUF3084 family)